MPLLMTSLASQYISTSASSTPNFDSNLIMVDPPKVDSNSGPKGDCNRTN